MDVARWLARERFERECMTEHRGLLADDAHLTHACWLDKGASLTAVCASLSVYGCRSCARTHHCQLDWDDCIKVCTESGGQVCAFSGRELAASSSGLTYHEEVRLASVLRAKPFDPTKGFVTRTTSNAIRNRVRSLNEYTRQIDRTERLLEREAVQNAMQDDGEPADTGERPAKRARRDSVPPQDGTGTDGAAEDDVMLSEMALIEVEEGLGAAEEDDIVSEVMDSVSDEAADDDDVESDGVGDGGDRQHQASDEDEKGTSRRGEQTGHDDPDLRVAMFRGDYDDHGVADDANDGDNNGGGERDEGANSALDSVLSRFGVSLTDMRANGGLDSDSLFRSNMRIMRKKSNIHAPWDMALDAPPATVAAGAYLQLLHEGTQNGVADALAAFDLEHRDLIDFSAAVERAVQMGKNGTLALSVSTPMTAMDYVAAVQRAQAIVREDVRSVMNVLCALLDDDAALQRTEIYERLALRLFDVIRHHQPFALHTLRAARLGAVLLLDLLHTSYHMNDQHALRRDVTPWLLDSVCSYGNRVLIWNADVWLCSAPVHARIDALLVSDAKNGSVSAVVTEARASRVMPPNGGGPRFSRTLIKTWATQIRTLLQQTPITPYALREVLFR